ncbi:MAG: hypothetical protein ABA06_00220 [Parcubacteria bacterium C7867-001]|nr:MAG: hypothetical protein ABA06_00220 [Parcubacteria bacterium C7867-001]
MKKILKELWDDPTRICMYLGYFTGVITALMGVLAIVEGFIYNGFGSKGWLTALIGLGLVGIGALCLAMFWFIWNVFKPWLFRHLHIPI